MVPFMRVLIVSALFVACVFGQSNKQPKPVFEVAADSAVGISKSPPVVESDGSASSQAAHNDTKSFLVDDSDDSDDSAESGNFNPHSGKTSGKLSMTRSWCQDARGKRVRREGLLRKRIHLLCDLVLSFFCMTNDIRTSKQ